MPAAARVMCLVPGCRRTHRPALLVTACGTMIEDQWICQTHWKLVPINRKRLYQRAKRALKKDPLAEKALVIWLWKRISTGAIDRALGI